MNTDCAARFPVAYLPFRKLGDGLFAGAFFRIQKIRIGHVIACQKKTDQPPTGISKKSYRKNWLRFSTLKEPTDLSHCDR